MFKRTAAAPAVITAQESDTAAATAAHGAYLTQVTQLVEDQSTVLFTMVTAAATHASTADQHITVTRAAHGLTVSVGAQAADLRIEAITAQPADMSRAWTCMAGQARCILPTADGTPSEWVLALQHSPSTGDNGVQHTHAWMDAKAVQPVTEAVVMHLLQSLFAEGSAEPRPGQA